MGCSVDKTIIIILSFIVHTSKNIKYRLSRLRMKATSFYSVIQRCQKHWIFVFYLLYCNLKEKDHLKRKLVVKKYLYMKSVLLLLFWSAENSVLRPISYLWIFFTIVFTVDIRNLLNVIAFLESNITGHLGTKLIKNILWRDFRYHLFYRTGYAFVADREFIEGAQPIDKL